MTRISSIKDNNSNQYDLKAYDLVTGELLSGANLNSITTGGRYYSTVSSTLTNAPTTNDFVLDVLVYD